MVGGGDVWSGTGEDSTGIIVGKASTRSYLIACLQPFLACPWGAKCRLH